MNDFLAATKAAQEGQKKGVEFIQVFYDMSPEEGVERGKELRQKAIRCAVASAVSLVQSSASKTIASLDASALSFGAWVGFLTTISKEELDAFLVNADFASHLTSIFAATFRESAEEFGRFPHSFQQSLPQDIRDNVTFINIS